MKRIVKTLLLLAFFASWQGVDAQDVKVISFNIRYWNNIDGSNSWPNRREAVVRMINEEKPAAIGLQEALIGQLQYFDSCLLNYRRVGVGREDGKEGGEFMAIYYDTTRMEYRGCDTWWLSEKPEEPSLGWDAACRRTVTSLHLRDRQSGKEFVYLNTHLDHVGKTARTESAKFIASIIEGHYFNVPVILGGDMNSTIDDKIFLNFYAIGLQAARTLTTPTSHADTYNAFGKGKSSLIDHFFVKELEVVRFRTLNDDYGVPYISDHYPIEIIIRL